VIMLQGRRLDGWRTPNVRWNRRTVRAVGAAAAVLYSSYLLEVVLPGRRHWTVVVSDLEMAGGRIAIPLRLADVTSGLLVLALLPAVREALPPGRWRAVGVSMTATFAVTNAVAALVPLPGPQAAGSLGTADEVQRWLHVGLSAASTITLALGAAAIACSVGRRSPWLRRAAWGTCWVTGVAGSVLLVVCHAREPVSWGTGLSQRLQITLTSLWILCLAYGATAGPPSGPHP
jgi:hypothetical protein